VNEDWDMGYGIVIGIGIGIGGSVFESPFLFYSHTYLKEKSQSAVQ